MKLLSVFPIKVPEDKNQDYWNFNNRLKLYKTSKFNEQVKKNTDRFDIEEFMFILDKDEYQTWCLEIRHQVMEKGEQS